MNPKIALLKLLKEIDIGKYSNIALNSFYLKNEIVQKEKPFITEVFYGTIRNRILINWIIDKFCKKIKKKEVRYILEISIYQILFMRTENRSVVWEAVEISKKLYGKQVGGFVNGVLKNFIKQKDVIIKELKDKKEYNILYSYPKWFIKYFANIDVDIEKLLKRYKETPHTGYRVNKKKYSQQDFMTFLERNGGIKKQIGDIFYPKEINLVKSNLYLNGKIFVQDYSSYFASSVLELKKDDKVLDMCAAPGTKTIAIAERADDSMKITANDIEKKKMKLIKENIAKSGADNINLKVSDAKEIPGEGIYDKILLDAPCSGFGVVAKKPEILYNKKYENVIELAKLQKELMQAAFRLLKSGGELVYSTCTIFPEENSENSWWFLSEFSDKIKVCDITPAENVAYHTDEMGGIIIDYKEEIADSFYVIKFRKM